MRVSWELGARTKAGQLVGKSVCRQASNHASGFAGRRAIGETAFAGWLLYKQAGQLDHAIASKIACTQGIESEKKFAEQIKEKK